MAVKINFQEAYKRLQVEHSFELTPSATFIERLRLLTNEQLAEIISVTLEEAK